MCPLADAWTESDCDFWVERIHTTSTLQLYTPLSALSTSRVIGSCHPSVQCCSNMCTQLAAATPTRPTPGSATVHILQHDLTAAAAPANHLQQATKRQLEWHRLWLCSSTHQARLTQSVAVTLLCIVITLEHTDSTQTVDSNSDCVCSCCMPLSASRHTTAHHITSQHTPTHSVLLTHTHFWTRPALK